MSATSPWEYDRLTKEYFLPISDTKSWKVYKTADGDYALTLHDDDVGYGGEVEFFDSLKKSKRAAIAKATGGAQ